MVQDNPNSLKNLELGKKITTDTSKDYGRRGGLKSAEVKKARKSMREMIDYLLTKTTTNSQGEEVSYQEGMLIAAVNKALNGDIKSMEFLRDTVGEKPVDRVDTTATTITRYITQEETKETNQHIDDVINGTR